MISLAMTSGDPSGIGPEIIFKLFFSFFNPKTTSEKQLAFLIRKKELSLHLIGSVLVFQDLIKQKKMKQWLKKRLGEKVNFFFSPNPKTRESTTLFLTMGDNDSLEFPFSDVDDSSWKIENRGKVNVAAGKIAKACLDKSVCLVKQGLCHGIVTAPISKESMTMVEEKFIGHTEYYAGAFSSFVSMAFLSPFFNLVLMTTHVALEDLPKQMTPKAIKRAIETGLKLRKFKGDVNKLLVLGFNPHAGENGRFGYQDELIKQIIHQIDKKGQTIEGPRPADSAFINVAKGDHQTVVACYHDQGLIPLKMLAKRQSTNVTLGLPCVRVSVDHGTAFDIANDFRAEYDSLAYAVKNAHDLVKGGAVELFFN